MTLLLKAKLIKSYYAARLQRTLLSASVPHNGISDSPWAQNRSESLLVSSMKVGTTAELPTRIARASPKARAIPKITSETPERAAFAKLEHARLFANESPPLANLLHGSDAVNCTCWTCCLGYSHKIITKRTKNS